MTKRIIDWAAKAALLLLALVPAVGVCRGQIAPEDFGTVKYLKQCPEYQRGYDPYASLSGTLQENVDVYSGKLNLTFPLPPVPWGATKTFSPVLIYNSNVWMRQESTAVTVGGETAAGKTLANPSENPSRPRAQMVRVFPEYWCNDAFVRFSPIGRPHAMPGWTLTVGGVYTEYCQDPSPQETCIVPDTGIPVSLRLAVKKKFFVAPDGSTHLLVDFQTNCRPYFSENIQTESCSTSTGTIANPTKYCLPASNVADARVWRAMDGSGYYYVEKVGVTATQGDVYGPDGTRYELDENGMIKSITDIDQNTVSVSTSSGTTSDGHPTKIVSFHGGSSHVTATFVRADLPNFIPTADYDTCPNGWESATITCWLLDTVTSPTVGGGEQTITFHHGNLISHLQSRSAIPSTTTTLTWSDIFEQTSFREPGSTEQVETGEFVFCKSGAPNEANLPYRPPLNSEEGNNSQIFVLTGISLPDGRQFSFDYNIAGKIKQITYPDGGSRLYRYGDTTQRSHGQSLEDFRVAARTWESALGGVSAVWQVDKHETTKVLEQALAYSAPKATQSTSDVLTTLVLKGDASVEIHDYMVQPDDEENKILRFGFSSWRSGKPCQVRKYDRKRLDLTTNPFTENEILTYFNPTTSSMINYVGNAKSWLGVNDASFMQKETYTYANGNDAWAWTAPSGLCACGGVSNKPMSCFYGDSLPTAADRALLGYCPESGNVMTRKELIIKGTLKKRFEWAYEDVSCSNGWKEPNARKVSECESDWNAADATNITNYIAKKHYSWKTYWPNPSTTAGLPLRVLAMLEEEKVTSGGGTETLAKTNYDYATTQTTSDRSTFHPYAMRTLISNSPFKEALTKYAYAGNPLRLSTVDVYEAGSVANRSAYEYESGGGRLLSKASVYNGTTSLVQYMLVRYDPYTGLLLRRTDRNGGSLDDGGKFVQFAYDACNRLQNVCLKEGATSFTLVQMSYPETTASPYWTLRKDYVKDGVWKETKTYNDDFGRPAATWTTLGPEGGSTQWAATQKQYDALGRVKTEYGPTKYGSCGSTSVTGRQTTHTYDGLGRLIKSSCDGVSTSASYGCSTSPLAATETFNDGENRGNTLYKDGLGRIIQVGEESPAGTTWTTTYGYDPLGNLTSVNQPDHERTFTYDCRGKVLSATLPELAGGKHAYSYDERGDLTLHKVLTSAGTLVLNEVFTVDGLGRTLTRVTTNGAKEQKANFGYDGANAYGRLSSDSTTYTPDGTAVGRSFTYDWKGLLLKRSDRMTIQGLGGATVNNSYATKYDYWPSGCAKQVSYPSGVTKYFDYAEGGGMTAIRTGLGSDGASLPATFSGIAYAAHGPVTATNYLLSGNSVKFFRNYDTTQLQLQSERVGQGISATSAANSASVLFALDYTSEKNNNVLSMNRTSRETVGSTTTYTMNQAYTYDELNRLASYQFNGTGYSNTAYSYNIDQFGNLTSESKSYGDSRAPASLSMTVEQHTNRLAGRIYDDLGNLRDVTGANNAALTLDYLDQGHVFSVTSSVDGLYRYYYDADGKRRIKAHGQAAGTTGYSYFIYDGDDLVCQMDAGDQVQSDPFYETRLLLTDHLGTTRAEMKTVNSAPRIIETYDTTPYGRLIENPAVPSENVVFSGKPRDKESGLDDFGARAYSQFLGRWTGPDEPFVDNHIQNPQSWNLFAYCRNNPACNIDPNGKQSAFSVSLEQGVGNPQWTRMSIKSCLAIINNSRLSFYHGNGGYNAKFGPVSVGVVENYGYNKSQPVLIRSYSVGPVTLTDTIPARIRTVTEYTTKNKGLTGQPFRGTELRTYWEPDPSKSYATTTAISVGGYTYDKYTGVSTVSWGIGLTLVGISFGFNIELDASQFVEDLELSSTQKISSGHGNVKLSGKTNTDQ